MSHAPANRMEQPVNGKLADDIQANNNYEQYESRYALDAGQQPASGRVSSGSGESAFSSASDSGEECASQLDSASERYSSPSSGRSSANPESSTDLSCDVRQLNTTCNLIPATREAWALVNTIRVKFLDHLKETDVGQNYDQLDIDELKKPLPPQSEQEQSLAFRLISRFLDFNQLSSKDNTNKELDEVLEKFKDFMRFRHHYQIPRVLTEQFCKELYLLNGIFPFGHDKQNLPVIYLRARVHRRWSHEFDETFRRYVAWQVNLITKSYSGAQVSKINGQNEIEKDGSFGICFDCLNVSYSCVDMDFLRFLVKILVNYYPTYCRYALCIDLPWLFRSVWKLVRSWLPEDAQNTVQLITSKQLTEFIDEDQIPNSIRINNLAGSEKPDKGKHKLPENWNSIRDFEDMAKELQLSPTEIKQFKSHLGKVLKEYEQLGAL